MSHEKKYVITIDDNNDVKFKNGMAKQIFKNGVTC